MKLSSRLQTCADMVKRGNCVADIGCDHGYLAIYLLKKGISPHVIAADLREKPLMMAKKHAKTAGLGQEITFCLSDGLEKISPGEVQTVICAGMGGDCICDILRGRPEFWKKGYQFILQPQSAASDLRKFLYDNGFSILEERFAQDGKFIYTILHANYETAEPLEPGAQFYPQGRIDRNDPLYDRYFHQIKERLMETVKGLQKAKNQNPEKLAFYQEGLDYILKQENKHENGK